jgi:hypothetical protein
MPTPRKYDNQAQRQAAYRARRAVASKGLPAIPGYRRWQAMIHTALAMLANIHREMDDYHQERSEPWRDSDQGEAFLERMDALEEIIDSLEAQDTSKEKTKS